MVQETHGILIIYYCLFSFLLFVFSWEVVDDPVNKRKITINVDTMRVSFL